MEIMQIIEFQARAQTLASNLVLLMEAQSKTMKNKFKSNKPEQQAHNKHRFYLKDLWFINLKSIKRVNKGTKQEAPRMSMRRLSNQMFRSV